MTHVLCFVWFHDGLISIQPIQEVDPACRQTILDNHAWMQEWCDHKTTEPHVFGDVLKQLPDNCLDEDLGFWDRRNAVENSGVTLEKTQFCHVHGRPCPLPQFGQIDVNMSGLPCQENSRMNFNRRFFEGRTGSCYIVWAKSHRDRKTPLLVLENTPVPLFHTIALFCFFCQLCLFSWFFLGAKH